MNFRSKTDVKACDDIRKELMPFVQSQYSASPKLLSLLESLRTEMDPRADYLLFYEVIFDISQAEGMGLDIWGRIVGISRNIYDEKTNYTVTLDDEDYRSLLMYKALANIMQSTPASLNKLIQLLYPSFEGKVIVIEEYDKNENDLYYNKKPMHIRWVFLHFMTDNELAVFKIAGTLCRGAGVDWGLYSIEPQSVFGFDGSNLQPFNQGIFDPQGVWEG